MFSVAFLKATAERVILVFAYTLATSLFVGGELLDIRAIRWGEALTMAGAAALAALLKCVIASQFGVKGSPGLVRDPAAVPAGEHRRDPDGHVRVVDRGDTLPPKIQRD